ncbi:MAG: putative flippase GtrA [Candidatus Nanohaloarchaea archaeon]|jgi:putative flippase GtrA
MLEDVSVIIPAINEEKFLEETIEDTLDYIGSGSEIVLVTDPSTDRTQEIAKQLAEKHDQVVHVQKNQRHGKGRAIEEGVRHSKNQKIAFMDADSATTPDQLEKIIKPLKDGYDIAVGSRYLPESDTERKKLREIPSRLFNIATSNILDTGIKDHQCGFKAFKKNDVEEMMSLEDGGFPWDLEFLYKANKKGLKIAEIPVRWRTREGSEVNSSTYLSFIDRIYFLALDKYFGDRSESMHNYGKFAFVGGLGAIVNTILLYIFTDIVGIHYIISGALSIEAAIIAMFFLNNRFTFTPVKQGIKQVIDGLIVSNVVRSVGIVAQLAILYLLTDMLNIYYLLSNIVAIFVSSILTFLGESRYNWN